MEYTYHIVLRVLFHFFSFCVLLTATAVVLLSLPFVPYSVVHSSCCSVFLFLPLPVPPSSCYSVFPFLCLPVPRSSRYSVFLFPRLPVIPSSCSPVFLLFCLPVPPSSCYSVFLFPRHPVIMSSCFSVFLFPVFPLFCLPVLFSPFRASPFAPVFVLWPFTRHCFKHIHTAQNLNAPCFFYFY